MKVLFSLITVLAVVSSSAMSGSKMIATPVSADEPPIQAAVAHPDVYSSNVALYVGDCDPDDDFDFMVDGGSGRAMVGMNAGVAFTMKVLDDSNGTKATLHANGPPVPHFLDFTFYQNKSKSMEATPITFQDVAQDGIMVRISCNQSTPIVAIVRSDSQLKLNAQVTESEDGGTELVQLMDHESEVDLWTDTRIRIGTSTSLNFANASNSSIEIKRGNETGWALIQARVRDDFGNAVHRTFVKKTMKMRDTTVHPVRVKCCEINDNNDLVVEFPDLGTANHSLRVEARFGIVSDGETKQFVNVVTMINADSKSMVLHGGWVRRAVQEHGYQGKLDGWDITLVNFVVTDPENGYRPVGTMGQVISNGIPLGSVLRQKLADAPSDDELNISDEMLFGRMPNSFSKHHNIRGLSDNHKKILVHGYCSMNGNPWPIADFTDAVLFYGGTYENNWSHDEFARKIQSFGSAYDGCGCIAHSQGGAACLHLHTYYWSCLDNAVEGGSRLIQTVGTPYHGTPLADEVARLGEIFDVGCGPNYDLSDSGAAVWLTGIPLAARRAVNYYTTSFGDTWKIDYCSLATDLLLDDPEDGVVEETHGQLWGANNRGHKTGWCHAEHMAYPPHTLDSERNSEMNSFAKY